MSAPRGPRFAAFCERFVRHTKGRWSGQPFVLEPWQREFWWEALEVDPAADLRMYSEAGLGLPRWGHPTVLTTAAMTDHAFSDPHVGPTVRRLTAARAHLRLTAFMDILESLFRSDAGAAYEHAPGSLAVPTSAPCQECGSGFNLRMCASCGHVGCCESQAGHARAHARSESHPVILSLPVGRGFTWCYEENAYAD